MTRLPLEPPAPYDRQDPRGCAGLALALLAVATVACCALLGALALR